MKTDKVVLVNQKKTYMGGGGAMNGWDGSGHQYKATYDFYFNYLSSKKWVPSHRWWVYTIWCRKELLSEVIIIFPSSYPNIGPAQGRGYFLNNEDNGEISYSQLIGLEGLMIRPLSNVCWQIQKNKRSAFQNIIGFPTALSAEWFLGNCAEGHLWTTF